MIKANELRIGDVLRNGTSVGHYTVCMIEESGTIWFAEMEGHSYDLVDNDIGGMLLTEEWLERMGFVEDEYYKKNFVISGNGECVSVSHREDADEYWRGWIVNNDRSDACCHRITKIEYVHQLQNLYFALTGEELSINEKHA